MASLIVSAIAKWNGAALKKGQKDLTAFQKTTLSLGKTFATVFAAQKIYQFGKASVKAFIADEKAAKSLAITLKNTGNGFATIATEGFISRMQQTYKVLDDDLRPAFQTLLTATGDLTLSQSALELALNISAGTGKDLQTVTAALAKGYAGNTTALSRLGAGLDKALIATGDMDMITAELTKKFSGQALGATKTYAGQMAALGVASENAKEIIGKGLLDALAVFSSDNSIDEAAKNMESFATSIADAIRGFAELSKTIADSAIGKFLAKGLSYSVAAKFFDFLGKYGRSKGGDAAKTAEYSSTSMYFTVEQAERGKIVKTLKTQNATEKEKQRLAAIDLAAKKKQAELDELKKQFDIGRINLETALLNSKDDAEKARIRSLLTIMDEDANSAAKRMAELDATNAAKMKAELAAADALKYLASEAARAALGLASIGNPKGIYPSYSSGSNFTYGEFNVPDFPSDVSNAGDYAASTASSFSGADLAGMRYQAQAPINITIEAPNGSEEYLTEAVKRAMQKLNRYGDSTTFAGAL